MKDTQLDVRTTIKGQEGIKGCPVAEMAWVVSEKASQPMQSLGIQGESGGVS